MAYADDLAITGHGRIKAKKALKIVEKWGEEASMKINKKKSGIMFIRQNKRQRRN